MIGYLKGNLIEKTPQLALVLVGDIGYEIHIGERYFYQLGEIDEKVTFFIHTNVREDAIELFGFLNKLDKKVFTYLISVSGIGAKSAMQILGKVEAETIIEAIIKENIAFLTKLPTVGKKTASRLIVELADKFSKEFSLQDNRENLRHSEVHLSNQNTIISDVIDGLKGLGYSEKEISTIIPELEGMDGSMEFLFKVALSLLAKG